jgi:protein-tyrosine-phosphatase
MNKDEAKELVKKSLEKRNKFVSFGIEIYEEENGSIRVSYLAILKKHGIFIPGYKEQVIEINFQDYSVLVSAPLSVFK